MPFCGDYFLIDRRLVLANNSLSFFMFLMRTERSAYCIVVTLENGAKEEAVGGRVIEDMESKF